MCTDAVEDCSERVYQRRLILKVASTRQTKQKLNPASTNNNKNFETLLNNKMVTMVSLAKSHLYTCTRMIFTLNTKLSLCSWDNEYL